MKTLKRIKNPTINPIFLSTPKVMFLKFRGPRKKGVADGFQFSFISDILLCKNLSFLP
jgi:hypothetical protein